jgi:hypothetical protein
MENKQAADNLRRPKIARRSLNEGPPRINFMARLIMSA